MCIDWVSKVRLNLDKLPDVCQYEGKKKPAGIKLQYFCQYADKKKITNQRTKLISIYFRHYRIRINH